MVLEAYTDCVLRSIVLYCQLVDRLSFKRALFVLRWHFTAAAPVTGGFPEIGFSTCFYF